MLADQLDGDIPEPQFFSTVQYNNQIYVTTYLW